MTVQERNQQIETRFRTVREHLIHADPNDFDRQIPPTFVSCDWEHQTITYAFDMEPRFGNPHGMGHGGIVVAMLDCAQGSAIDCYSTDHPIIVTVSLQTSLRQVLLLRLHFAVRALVQVIHRQITHSVSVIRPETSRTAKVPKSRMARFLLLHLWTHVLLRQLQQTKVS